MLNKGKEVEDISYENLFNGTVKEKLRIAHKFEENLSVLEKMKKWNDWEMAEYPKLWDHVTWYMFVVSAVLSELEIYYYYYY